MSGFDLIITPDVDDAEAAEILVDGTIDGHPYRFLLDTGAARSSVISDAYTAGFASTEQQTSPGVFAKSIDELIVVPQLALGPVSKSDFVLARLSTTRPDARNLIGMDFLKDACYHFLFSESRVEVDALDASDDAYTYMDLFMGTRFHPYVTVELGGVQVAAVWDTGAGMTVVDSSFIDAHADAFEPAGDSQGTDSTGATMDTPMFIMAPARIGTHVFAAHKVASVDLSHVNSTTETPMTMILGYSTLSQAHWIFDFPRKRWAISRFLPSR